MNLKENLNVEIGDVVVPDVAEKVGSIFGEEGKLIGRIIDSFTKKVTIKIDEDEG